MLLQDQDIQLLTQIGFTENQAKLYLTLLSIGETDAKNLSRQANVPRQAAYRTLGELQEKGLVERRIAVPQEYKAIPLKDGLAIMINQKSKEYKRILQEAQEFLLNHETQKRQDSKKEYNISIIEGKETIVKKTKYTIDNAASSVCICSTAQRWIHFTSEIIENAQEALNRGVKYRVILENSNGEILFPKEFKKILNHRNYELRIVHNQLKVNAAIFDDREASFSFYPSKSLTESPMIWTNHSSLLIGFMDHFENLWKNSEKLDLKGKFN